jgi:hypothetical protein
VLVYYELNAFMSCFLPPSLYGVFLSTFLQTIALSSSESYDFVRALRMAGYGMLILGPSLHFWFNFVSKLFPKRDLFSTLKKMVMGQTLYGPAMTVVFFSTNAFLQGIHDSLLVKIFPMNIAFHYCMCTILMISVKITSLFIWLYVPKFINYLISKEQKSVELKTHSSDYE